jgi:phage gp29-like protein
VAWVYLFKNYALKDWNIFNEVFGMPLRLGKYDPSASNEERESLQQAITSLGSDAAAIISKDTEIEFIETHSRGGSRENPFMTMAEFCNREMSKAILGQTLTTDVSQATGTYGAAKVHHQVRRDIIQSDADNLTSTLRGQLIKPLVGFNFGWDRSLPYLQFYFEEDVDLKALSETYKNLSEMGVSIPKGHIAEVFGLPKLEGGGGNS